jgi:hypothetical protein
MCDPAVEPAEARFCVTGRRAGVAARLTVELVFCLTDTVLALRRFDLGTVRRAAEETFRDDAGLRDADLVVTAFFERPVFTPPPLNLRPTVGSN